MKILFVHNNFPAQFKHLAPALAASGEFEVASISLEPKTIPGITSYTYKPTKSSSADIHPWLLDFETKVIRGQACLDLAKKISQSGYAPDCIIAHPGWGEALFLKEVWPKAKLGIYCEFYYQPKGYDFGYESNYTQVSIEDICHFRLKNLCNDLTMSVADAGISPTQWQASSFPEGFRDKITVVHDGIDTRFIKPDHSVAIQVNGRTLSKSDEVVTFVNRNLEPYRGYDVFMHALPKLLNDRPNANVLIVGGDGLSYGAAPENGKSWKQIYIDEVWPLLTDQQKSRVCFLGNLPYEKYLAVLKISSAHVYLTYPFVLSWSLLEAMSLGCCIIAGDTAPLQEVIAGGYNGLLVPFGAADKLAATICEVLNSKPLRIQLGFNARESVVAKYDLYNTCLPKQIKWIEQLLS